MRKNLKEARPKAGMKNNQLDEHITGYTIEYRREDGTRIKEIFDLPQVEYKRLMGQYTPKYHKEQKCESFLPENIDRFLKSGEEIATAGFVKTDSFEKAITFLMTLTEAIWRIAQEHKSFRMELFYDAETLNTNYYFFGPTDKSGSELSQREREEKKH